MIIPVPCLADNYAYLIPNGSGGAVVVDPGEAQPVHEALVEHGLRLEAILCTHHHRDHIGGNLALRTPRLEVVAHASERQRIPGFTRGVEDEERFELAGLEVRAFHLPGHTRGAVSYEVQGALFSGDTLFCAGCGRLREGTALQLHASLCRLTTLVPADLAIYTGHEYTEKNLRFAAAVEPGNQAISQRLVEIAERRRRGLFCASTTLEEELATNPFLRTAVPEVQAAVQLEDAEPALVFAKLRQWKDAF